MAEANYRNLIFSKHALQRLGERSISQEDVFQTINSPDKKYDLDEKDSFKFIKQIHDRHLQIVAKYLSKEKKYLIISLWVRGEEDKTPFLWRLISFPFWLIWKVFQWLYQQLFSKKNCSSK